MADKNLFFRKIFKELIEWRSDLNESRPLILLGARQVGKTHLLKLLNNNYLEGSSLHYFNFERPEYVNPSNPSNSLELCFTDFDIEKIIERLSAFCKKNIKKNDLIVFDEIQDSSNALMSLKYFCEHGTFKVACAGSALGIHLSRSTFPVGKVKLITLYPLCFEEFLMAHLNFNNFNSEVFIDKFKNLTLNSLEHTIAEKAFFDFLYVGGMPKVLLCWFNSKLNILEKIENSRTLQLELLKGYQDDMAKYADSKDAISIAHLYAQCAYQLGRNDVKSVARFKFKNVLSGKKEYSQFIYYFDYLSSAHLIYKNYIIMHQPHYPLNSCIKESFFKIFYHDLGLLGARLDISYQAIIENNYGYFKGFYLENFAACELIPLTNNGHLLSWHEGDSEIEFLWATKKGAIFPIEVKSKSKSRAKSLKSYEIRYSPKFYLKFGADEKMPLYNISILISKFSKL